MSPAKNKETTCMTCLHAKWQMVSTGRRDFTKGVCDYPIQPLPHSFLRFHDDMPTKQRVNKWTKGNCPCWAKIKTTTAADRVAEMKERDDEE
jgi:hypothetical protein